MKRLALSMIVVGMGAVGCIGAPETTDTVRFAENQSGRSTQHVLLVSLDGFHPFDLDNYIASHPNSAMAELASRGVVYANTTSARPSDSFPGSLAMVTGGSPSSTGVFYDNAWDDDLSPPGSDCSTRGTNTLYDESDDVNVDDINTTIDPNTLPRDPDNGCAPVYPHTYLQVNTLFEVIRAAGGLTAYSDKHPTYDIYNGPSGTGVMDLYTPEADAGNTANDVLLTEGNDELKVQSVLNQIDGFDHTGTNHVGVPAIFGMDFQTPNISMKFAGYDGDTGLNTPGQQQAFDYLDDALGRMTAELRAQGLLDSTLFIVGAKHGNSPVKRSLRQALDDGPYEDLGNTVAPGLVAQVTTDTTAIIWLTDHSKAAQVAAVYAQNKDLLGIDKIYFGDALRDLFGGQEDAVRNRRPDIMVQPKLGVIYTSHDKFVEHGSFNSEDTHVALLVSQPGLNARRVKAPVQNQQIAPTILKALGLAPRQLQAVRLEHTPSLPGLNLDGE